MKLRKSCFGMDYEMETPIQALVIQINMVWNQFHGIIHELIGYALALLELKQFIFLASLNGHGVSDMIPLEWGHLGS